MPRGIPNKKSEEEVQDSPQQDNIEHLKRIGLPIKRAVFHDTVQSRTKDNMPNFAYYNEHQKKDRKAKMWYTHIGLLMEQEDGHKIIPLANVKETDLL